MLLFKHLQVQISQSSITVYMTASYEELVKSGKKLEKVGTIGKNWESIFLTVYEALHMKIYEPPHMNFGELRSPGSTRSSPGSTRSAGKHPQRRTAFGNCGNKLKY